MQPNTIAYSSSRNIFRLTGSEAKTEEEARWLEWRKQKRAPGGKNNRGLQINFINASERTLSSSGKLGEGTLEEAEKVPEQPPLKNQVVPAIDNMKGDSQRLFRQLHANASDANEPQLKKPIDKKKEEKVRAKPDPIAEEMRRWMGTWRKLTENKRLWFMDSSPFSQGQ